MVLAEQLNRDTSELKIVSVAENQGQNFCQIRGANSWCRKLILISLNAEVAKHLPVNPSGLSL